MMLIWRPAPFDVNRQRERMGISEAAAAAGMNSAGNRPVIVYFRRRRKPRCPPSGGLGRHLLLLVELQSPRQETRANASSWKWHHRRRSIAHIFMPRCIANPFRWHNVPHRHQPRQSRHEISRIKARFRREPAAVSMPISRAHLMARRK